MCAKRKQYLYDERAPITKYAITKTKKLINKTELHVQQRGEICSASNSCSQPNPTITQQLIENIVENRNNVSVDYSQDTILPADDDNNRFFNYENVDSQTSDTLYEDIYSTDEELSLLQKKSTKTTRDLLDDSEFFELMSLNVRKSPAELLLIALKYSISNSLSVSGISNLLKFINIICGKDVLPDNRYRIDQLCAKNENITLHAICPTCSQYLGIFDDCTISVNCSKCNTKVDMSNPSNPCYFAIINPSDAIRDYLEANENYYDYVMNERQYEHNHIKDIYDGTLYRKFVESIKESDRNAYATLVFNTDGAPVFESSTYSIWPIYLIINEIPIQERLRSVITTGLWFGPTKPEMDIFLNKFVNLMNDLSITGIPCRIKNEKRTIKVYPLIACVDTVARAPMNGTSQFNANYGCDWCLHEGYYHNGSMRYPFETPLPKDRNHADTTEHAREAVRTKKRVFGVKTASPLLNLKKFDIINGFTPDYMHCYAAGVGKQFTEYILNHLTKTDEDLLEDRFKNLRVPNQLCRLSRSLKARGNYKSREYENLLLYYSIPTFTEVLTHHETILKHWSLLVDALHICLQTDITFEDLNYANELLFKFVAEAEDTYDLTALTYNVHQLLHIVKSIYDWGPLYCHSTYAFEAANHKLVKSIHCAKGVISQIIRYENIQRIVQILENKIYLEYPGISTFLFCENLISPLVKKAFKIRNITYIDKEQVITDNLIHKFKIEKSSSVYHKIVYRGSLFMTSKKKIDDHVIIMRN